MCNFVTYSIQYTCTYMHSILVHVFRNKAKGRISKRVFQENKARQIFRKTNISYPLIRTRTYCWFFGKKCWLFGKFGVLCFLVTTVLRFVLLLYYRRSKMEVLKTSKIVISPVNYFRKSPT